MAGQLSPGDRLRRLRRAGLGVLALAALAVAALAWVAARAVHVSQARYVVRPEISVQGVVAGSLVRLNGVVVGRVSGVGLWADPGTRHLRPEVVLTLDASRDPSLADLRSRVAEGLRVEFVPVNPAAGFLEVDLVWSPGSPPLLATGDADELPWKAGERQQAFVRAIAVIRQLAADDIQARVGDLLGVLAAVERRVADGPSVAEGISRRATRLRSLGERLESAAGPDAVAVAQLRLADLGEGLRVAADACASLDRRLAAWPAPLGSALRAFSADCRSLAERLRRQSPPDPGR